MKNCAILLLLCLVFISCTQEPQPPLKNKLLAYWKTQNTLKIERLDSLRMIHGKYSGYLAYQDDILDLKFIHGSLIRIESSKEPVKVKEVWDRLGELEASIQKKSPHGSELISYDHTFEDIVLATWEYESSILDLLSWKYEMGFMEYLEKDPEVFSISIPWEGSPDSSMVFLGFSRMHLPFSYPKYMLKKGYGRFLPTKKGFPKMLVNTDELKNGGIPITVHFPSLAKGFVKYEWVIEEGENHFLDK